MGKIYLSFLCMIALGHGTELVPTIKTAQTLLAEAVDDNKNHAEKSAAATELIVRLDSLQVCNPRFLDRNDINKFFASENFTIKAPRLYLYLARRGVLDFNEATNKTIRSLKGTLAAALLEYYENPESVFFSPHSWTYETPFDDLVDQGDEVAQYKRARILMKVALKTPIISLLPSYLASYFADYLIYFDDSLLSEAVKLMYLSARGGHPKAQYLYGILEWGYFSDCRYHKLSSTETEDRWKVPYRHGPLTKYWGVGTHHHNFAADLVAVYPSQPTKMLERSTKQEYPPALYFMSRAGCFYQNQKENEANITKAAQYGLTDAIRHLGFSHIDPPFRYEVNYARAYLELHRIEHYDLSARAALMELFQFGNGEYSDHGYQQFCDYRDSLKDDPQWYQKAFLFISTNPANKDMAEFHEDADFPYFNKYSYLTAAGNIPEALYGRGRLITKSSKFKDDLIYGTSRCWRIPRPLFENAWNGGFKTDKSLQALISEYHREGNLYQEARLLVEGINRGLDSAKYSALDIFQFDTIEEFQAYRKSKETVPNLRNRSLFVPEHQVTVPDPDWIKDRFVDCGVVKYKAGNFSTSEKYLQNASQDDGRQNYYLGRIYEKEFKNPKTHKNQKNKLFPQIKSLYEKAYARGFQKAAYRLAQYWLHLEYATLTKEEQILKYMDQLGEAAKGGSAKAQFELGINLQNGGNGFIPSQKRSLEWINCAATQGNKRAKLHQEFRKPVNSEETNENTQKIKFLNKRQKLAENKRKKEAQKYFDSGLRWEDLSKFHKAPPEATLSDYYWRNATNKELADRLNQEAVDKYNQISGQSGKEDLMTIAFDHYNVARSLKHPEAARHLALLHLHGTGVRTKPTHREYMYLTLLREAADVYYDKAAQYDLALILSKGLYGAPINEELSDFYMAAAAAQKHQIAQSNMECRGWTPFTQRDAKLHEKEG